jgi:protein-tyrosine phosphatase
MIKISTIFTLDSGGSLILSQCPGKNMSKGRDGKVHSRDIRTDLLNFKDQGISMIICLLNDYELRSIGVQVDLYKNSCKQLDLLMIQFPVIEMAAPSSVESVELAVLSPVTQALTDGRKVLVHCRGGIGRAGTIACCLLLKLHLCPSPKQAISLVRSKRDPRCVESRKQEDFIKNYFKTCSEINNLG